FGGYAHGDSDPGCVAQYGVGVSLAPQSSASVYASWQAVRVGFRRRTGAGHVELRGIRATLERHRRNGSPTKDFSADSAVEYSDEYPHVYPARLAGDCRTRRLAGVAHGVHR